MIPSNLEDLEARELFRQMRATEEAIIEKVVELATKGVNGPIADYATQQLANTQRLRETLIRQFGGDFPTEVQLLQAGISAAYRKGGDEALRDLIGKADLVDPINTPAGRATITALTREVADKTASAYNSILRTVPDQYREIIGDVATAAATGRFNTREAVSEALVKQFRRGITVAPANSRGARMSLADYTIMAMRTATARAAVEGHSQALLQNGLNLCMIQLGPRNCDICDGWANKVLSIDGSLSGTVVQPNYGEGPDEIKIKIDGSLPEARAAGWGHPNCRCGIRSFIPGVTKPDPRRIAWDQEGYEAQQRQRDLERQIRDAKLESQLAISPEERARANAKLRAAQQKQRDLLEEKPFLKRQPGRESLQVGPLNVQPRSTNTRGGASGLKRSATEAEYKARLDKEFGNFKKSDGSEWGQPDSPEMQRLFKRYTTNEGYGFNEELRIRANGGDVRSTWDTGTSEAQKKKYLKGADNLAAEVHKAAPTTEDLRLTRYLDGNTANMRATFTGVPPEAFDDPAALADALVGKRYRSDGFFSTSYFDPEGGTPVNPDAYAFYLDVLAPKGSVGVNVDSISQYQGELEVLFAPGVKYTIVDAVPHQPIPDVNGYVAPSGVRVTILLDPESTAG